MNTGPRKKLVPYFFGPLPVEALNAALQLELEPGDVVMSVNAQIHAQRRHPKDYARSFPHVASVVTGPLYVRDDFKNHDKIELVARPDGFPDWLLVAVEISLDEDGRYNVASFYPVSEKKVQKRRDNGHYVRLVLV